jgi:hypothetical protein
MAPFISGCLQRMLHLFMAKLPERGLAVMFAAVVLCATKNLQNAL